jgi:hypothetical protein
MLGDRELAWYGGDGSMISAPISMVEGEGEEGEEGEGNLDESGSFRDSRNSKGNGAERPECCMR